MLLTQAILTSGKGILKETTFLFQEVTISMALVIVLQRVQQRNNIKQGRAETRSTSDSIPSELAANLKVPLPVVALKSQMISSKYTRCPVSDKD